VVWRKTSEVYNVREAHRFLCDFVTEFGSLYPAEDFRSLEGGLFQHSRRIRLTLSEPIIIIRTTVVLLPQSWHQYNKEFGVKKSLPWWLVAIAVFQVVPIMIFPLDTLESITIWVWTIPAALFALLGWGLFSGRLWARTSTTFIQGFSIIGRLLSLLPGAMTVLSKSEGTTVVNTPLIVTSLLSIVLSTIILVSVDRPEVTATLK